MCTVGVRTEVYFNEDEKPVERKLRVGVEGGGGSTSGGVGVFKSHQ